MMVKLAAWILLSLAALEILLGPFMVGKDRTRYSGWNYLWALA